MDFVLSLLSQPAVLLGIVACVGLIAQKKDFDSIVSGTIKTVIGFLIFGIGASTMTGVLQNFNKLFQTGFNIVGVIASPEAATALVNQNYGFVASMTMIVACLCNVIFARFTPFKIVDFHTGGQLFFSSCLALVFKAHGYSDIVSILAAGIIIGLAVSVLPYICQPFIKKITGTDSISIGHTNMVGYCTAGILGKLFASKKDETTENIKFPKALNIFKDYLLGMSIIMTILFYISALKAGSEFTTTLSGSTHWLVYPVLQGIQFGAGMSILMSGVRMFTSEITAAFVAISEKFIPGSRSAVDCPVFFPYAPTAVMVGFMSSYVASLISILIMVMLKFPMILFPAAHMCFFAGGTAAIFGNSTGGWRGAVLGSFVAGLMLSFLPLALYPLMASMGIAGSAFAPIDANVVSILVHSFLSLFEAIF